MRPPRSSFLANLVCALLFQPFLAHSLHPPTHTPYTHSPTHIRLHTYSVRPRTLTVRPRTLFSRSCLFCPLLACTFRIAMDGAVAAVSPTFRCCLSRDQRVEALALTLCALRCVLFRRSCARNWPRRMPRSRQAKMPAPRTSRPPESPARASPRQPLQPPAEPHRPRRRCQLKRRRTSASAMP